MTMKEQGFSEYLAGELGKYGRTMVPVKAGLLERKFVKKAAIKKIHPNPDDEFSVPEIGPNYSIISNYMARYQKYGRMSPPEEIEEEPLIVQKVYPDGYKLLNGHHRWAAYWKLDVSRAPVSIVNLTQETDIKKMIDASTHDKRAALDLDEVVFCRKDEPAEKQRRSIFGKRFHERIREGIPSVLHYLTKQGYDIWIYTAKDYSMDDIRAYFRKYMVKVDGIITGTGRAEKADPEAKKRVDKLFRERYTQTLHIDRDMILRTFAEEKDFEEYPVEETGFGWAQTVVSIITEMEKNDKKEADKREA